MTGVLVDLIFGPIGAGFGAVLALLVAYLRGRARTKKDVEHDAMQDTLERTQKGRNAVRDGRGRDPADRLRDNHSKW